MLRRLRNCPCSDPLAANHALEMGLYSLADDGQLDGPAAEAYNAGVHAYHCHDIDVSIRQFELAASLEPAAWPIRNNLGIALVQSGRTNDGIEHLRSALADSGDDEGILRNLGAALWVNGQLEEAEACLVRAVEQQPEFVASWYVLAHLRRARADTDGAVDAMRCARDLQPDSCALNDCLGAFLHVAGRHEEALETYRLAIEADPNHPLPHYNIAKLLASMARWEESAEAYRRHIAMEPDHSCPHLELGRVLARLDGGQEALSHLTRYAESEPEDPQGHASAAVELAFADRPQEALDRVDHALTLDRTDAWIWSVRTGILEKLDRIDEALGDIDRALELDPAVDAWHARKAFLLARAGRGAEAIESLERVAEEDRPVPARLVTRALIDVQDWIHATIAARTLARLAPREVESWGMLGLSLFQGGEFGEAHECFTRALEIDPHNRATRFWMAQTLLRIHQPARALELTDGLRASDGDRPDLLELWASCLIQLNRLEEAEFLCRDLIKREPTCEMARAFIEDVEAWRNRPWWRKARDAVRGWLQDRRRT